MNSAGQADAQVVWEAKKGNRLLEENLRAAVIAALNQAVPKAYRRVQGNAVGSREYRPTDCPKQIIAGLRQFYGILTPREREIMEKAWAKPWSPSDPIESYFDALEEVFMKAVRHPPQYTMDQMICKAITAIQVSGVMPQHLLEWNGFELRNQNWANLRPHFAEAYQLIIAANQGVFRAPIGLANNASEQNVEELTDDDTSVSTIIGSMQAANAANQQAVGQTLAQIGQQMNTMAGELQALRLERANYTAVMQPPAPPPYVPPAPAPIIMPPANTYQNMQAPSPYGQNAFPPPAPAMAAIQPYVPPPPQNQQQNQQYGRRNGGRGGGRWGGRGGFGRGRGNRGRNSLAFGDQPPTQQAQQQYAAQQQGQQQQRQGQQRNYGGNYQGGGARRNNQGGQPPMNYVKFYDNRNWCYSCGADVPDWHTSRTCPPACRKPTHREDVDRSNAVQYHNAGWDVCMAKSHKNVMPDGTNL